MELHLFTSILTGTLKPWANGIEGNRFYSNSVTPQLVNSKDFDIFQLELKRILGKSHEVFQSDSFEIYLTQNQTKESFAIQFPLLTFPEPSAQSAMERFYFPIIKNESYRLFQRLFDSFSRDILRHDRTLLINTFYSNLKLMLIQVGNSMDQITSNSAESYNVIYFLQNTIIRMLYETHLTYSDYLLSLPLDEYQIFHEILSTDVPSSFLDSIKPTNNLKEVIFKISNVNLKFDLKKNAIDAFSFGYVGDRDKLAKLLYALNKEFEMLHGNSTADEMFSVLTSKNLDDINIKIYLQCETKQFRYIIDKLKPNFQNLKLSSIEKSAIFYSYNDPNNPLKAQNLSSSKSHAVKQKDLIDSLFTNYF